MPSFFILQNGGKEGANIKFLESVLRTNWVNEYAFDFSRGYFYFSAGYFTCSKLHNSITVNRCRYRS